MVTVLLIVLALIGLDIQFTNQPIARRLSLARGLASSVAPVFAVVSAVSLEHRGLSRSAGFLFAVVLLLSGVFLVFVSVDCSALSDPRSQRSKNRMRRLQHVFLGWCLLATVTTLVSLQYAGALGGDRVSSAIARGVSFGQFSALVADREIAIGQCTKARVPKARNKVVPCALDHRSQVIDAVGEPSECPDAEIDLGHGLRLKVSALSPIDGVVYCVLQSEVVTMSWRRRVDLKTMAYTP